MARLGVGDVRPGQARINKMLMMIVDLCLHTSGISYQWEHKSDVGVRF